MEIAMRVPAWGLLAALTLAPLAGSQTQRADTPSSPAAQPSTPAGATTAKPPRFEVASIRMIPEDKVVPLTGSTVSPPGAGQFTMRQVTLLFAISWAFRMNGDRISGGPAWLSNQYYEISAKPEGDAALTYDQLRPLMQQLLQERFHLVYHRETKQVKGYALVIAKGGPKLKASTAKDDFGYIATDRVGIQNRPVQQMAGLLEILLHQPVADKTGLRGNYDITLNYAPTDAADSELPSIFAAVEEQLGLKLVSQMVPVETLVIDRVDREPTEN
jgi:uncharacterized protein (TIGR03435 family)